MNLSNFLEQVPSQGYHARNGEVDVFSEKNLCFECGCGLIHSVHDSTAILDSALTNEVVYLCPRNDGIFNLVKATGFFRIKGLKTLTFFKSENNEERNSVMLALESRKKRNG
tara:strand:+ start:2643 stop:2978 length:336 start_codon:yes stop_codon:yes gene_type:complete